ncbi:SH3 domain-containing protein [Corallococcus sp. AB032C]|uniref:SH3 domain-containing protein n=1 Tax=Corallococcus TaxID=83461 RepID=UPI000EE01E7D|nr:MULTISPECIES: SH3 domain-containing protein [Corallococcus]NPC45519.1 SH3 domain-containing protein [Corallococcus exiguus]RKH84676.1 SH3 domain-containing protein [Corallococcus sp. AB032C]
MGDVRDDGEAVGRVGIIQWDGASEVRLRATRSTTESNIIQTLPFNTTVQVIRRWKDGWAEISTRHGQTGFAASEYIWTHLPEPSARLHRVEAGVPGTAIAIAEAYYGDLASQWGQDLRFFVNVLAHTNRLAVPSGTTGWREVHFRSDTLIWIPGRHFAQSLSDVVNSGSRSFNLATTLESTVARVTQLWDDFHRAVALSTRYLSESVTRHTEKVLQDIVMALAEMVLGGIAVLAVSTAIGAGIGALAGGVGAAPGAAAGFEIGLIVLEWLGLAMLLNWLVESLWKVAKAFHKFIGTVWEARGSAAAIDRAAREFAEAVATLVGAIMEGVIMLAMSRGVSWMVRALRGTALARKLGEARLANWLNKRLDTFRERRAGRPREVIGQLTQKIVDARYFRGVDLVQRTRKGRDMRLGELDGIDMQQRLLIEYKSARRLHRSTPPRDPADWANEMIYETTVGRIQALTQTATGTRPTQTGSATVPTLAEIQGFRRLQFRIDADTPGLRAGVEAALKKLRSAHPGWTFEVRWGIDFRLPPLPDWAIVGHHQELH